MNSQRKKQLKEEKKLKNENLKDSGGLQIEYAFREM